MPSRYFASLEPYSRELGSRLLALVDKHYQNLPSERAYQRARRVRQLYYGLPSTASPFDVTVVGRAGDAGELSAINVNRLHHLGQRFLTMGVSEDFGWQPVVANGDTASIEEGILAGSVLEHEKRASGLEKARHDFNELALLDGWSYFSVRWDPTAGPVYDVDPETRTPIHEGRLKVAVHEWWRCVTDRRRKDAKHDWVILTEFVSKYDLAAKYPNVAERILNLAAENRHVLMWAQETGRDWGEDESPLVPVYTFFHKPTPSVPDGREVVFVDGGVILHDSQSVYGEELPVYRVSAADMQGTPTGVSVLWDIVALQHTVNSLYSTEVTNAVNGGLNQTVVRRETNVNLAQIGTTEILEIDGDPRADIATFQMADSSPRTLNLAKEILSEMTTLVGMNSIALGQQQHQMPASLAALLDMKAKEFAGFFVRGDRQAVTNLGTAILRCYKQFARAPRVLEVIAGEGRRYMLQQFTGQRIGTISRVTVTMRSGMLSGPAGQMAFAEQILSSGAYENPAAMRLLVGLYQNGNLNVALQAAETTDMLMARENDMLAKGEVPVARALDKHGEHIRKHMEVMANPAVRLDDAVDSAVQEHIQWHIDLLRQQDPALLQLMGETPLPPVPGMPDPLAMAGGDPAAAVAGTLPPGEAPPPEAIPPGGMAEMMAGGAPNLPGLPQPAQPPGGAPPPLA